MARKRFTAEQFIMKLREAEVGLAQGQTVHCAAVLSHALLKSLLIQEFFACLVEAIITTASRTGDRASDDQGPDHARAAAAPRTCGARGEPALMTLRQGDLARDLAADRSTGRDRLRPALQGTHHQLAVGIPFSPRASTLVAL